VRTCPPPTRPSSLRRRFAPSPTGHPLSRPACPSLCFGHSALSRLHGPKAPGSAGGPPLRPRSHPLPRSAARPWLAPPNTPTPDLAVPPPFSPEDSPPRTPAPPRRPAPSRRAERPGATHTACKPSRRHDSLGPRPAPRRLVLPADPDAPLAELSSPQASSTPQAQFPHRPPATPRHARSARWGRRLDGSDAPHMPAPRARARSFARRYPLADASARSVPASRSPGGARLRHSAHAGCARQLGTGLTQRRRMPALLAHTGRHVALRQMRAPCGAGRPPAALRSAGPAPSGATTGPHGASRRCAGVVYGWTVPAPPWSGPKT
jgi:hypothetical protein